MQQNFVFLVSQTGKDWIGEISVETEKNERPKVLVLYIDVVVKKKARLRLNSFECLLSVVLMVLR